MKKAKHKKNIEIIEISKQTIQLAIYVVLLLRVIKSNASFYNVIVRSGAKGKDTLYDSGLITDINEAYELYETTKKDLQKTIGTL
jgi:hypothetical protein